MEINDLGMWQTFVQVAEKRNFVNAARALSTGAPAITKRISLLEERLGTRLFNRTTRVVTLTAEGEKLLPLARSLIESAQDLERQAQSAKELSGTIRLTCFQVVGLRWLTGELIGFRKKHPAIKFELDLTDRYADLIAEQIDIAIRVQKPKGADFVFRELATNELVICASPSYLKKAPRIRRPEDLVEHPVLAQSLLMNTCFLHSRRPLSDYESARSIRCESGIFLTELALKGAGVAVRSRWDVFPFLASGKLVELLPSYKLEPYGKAYMVIPQKRYLSPRVRAFADHLIAGAPALHSLTQ